MQKRLAILYIFYWRVFTVCGAGLHKEFFQVQYVFWPYLPPYPSSPFSPSRQFLLHTPASLLSCHAHVNGFIYLYKIWDLQMREKLVISVFPGSAYFAWYDDLKLNLRPGKQRNSFLHGWIKLPHICMHICMAMVFPVSIHCWWIPRLTRDLAVRKSAAVSKGTQVSLGKDD